MIDVLGLKWIAGFLEGEGCFSVSKQRIPRVNASQVQLWPLEQLHAELGGSIRLQPRRHRNSNHHDAHVWDISGQRAAGLMMTLYCLMSPDRKRQIALALTPWRNGRTWARYRQTCPRGHPYSGRWVRKDGQTHRQCGICRRDANRRHEARRPPRRHVAVVR